MHTRDALHIGFSQISLHLWNDAYLYAKQIFGYFELRFAIELVLK